MYIYICEFTPHQNFPLNWSRRSTRPVSPAAGESSLDLARALRRAPGLASCRRSRDRWKTPIFAMEITIVHGKIAIVHGKIHYKCGKSPFSMGKAPFLMGNTLLTMEKNAWLMGKLTISMTIFKGYLCLPDGKPFPNATHGAGI